jgi:hypothetical protein
MYIVQEFISNNSYNVIYEKATHEGDRAALIHKINFEENINFDTCNTEASPIFVYEWQGEPVAWFDMTNTRGYIKV